MTMSVGVWSLLIISSIVLLESACVDYKEYDSIEQFHQMNPNGDSATLSKRVNMTDAANNDGAVCIDGSIPVFYWRPGRDDGTNKFIIYFDGGMLYLLYLLFVLIYVYYR